MKNSNLNFQLVLTVLVTILLNIFLLFQSMIAAADFGISNQMDAYNISFNITTFIFSFFSVSVTTVLIPSMANKKSLTGTNTFITFFASVVLFIVFVIFLFGPKLLNIFYHNTLISTILLILTVGFLFKAFTGVLIAIYQVNDNFVLPKIIQALSALVVVVLLLFNGTQAILYYSAMISLGFIVEFFINLILLKKKNINYHYSFSLDFKDKEFRIMFFNFIPIFFSTALFQTMLLINVLIAERLGTGNVSILTYGNQLFAMVNSLLVVNILAILFPKLVRLITSDKKASIVKLEEYMIVVLTLMIFILAEFYLHGRDALVILFERGLFDASATEIVFQLSLIYFLLLPFGAVRDLFYRYFYADNDTKTPFKNSIIVSILNIALSIILSINFGIYGIVLGTVIAGILSVIMIIIRFKKKYNALFSIKVITIEIFKLIVIGCMVIGLEKLVFGYFAELYIIIRNLLLIPFSSILFFGLLYIFKGRIFTIRI